MTTIWILTEQNADRSHYIFFFSPDLNHHVTRFDWVWGHNPVSYTWRIQNFRVVAYCFLFRNTTTAAVLMMWAQTQVTSSLLRYRECAPSPRAIHGNWSSFSSSSSLLWFSFSSAKSFTSPACWGEHRFYSGVTIRLMSPGAVVTDGVTPFLPQNVMTPSDAIAIFCIR